MRFVSTLVSTSAALVLTGCGNSAKGTKTPQSLAADSVTQNNGQILENQLLLGNGENRNGQADVLLVGNGDDPFTSGKFLKDLACKLAGELAGFDEDTHCKYQAGIEVCEGLYLSEGTVVYHQRADKNSDKTPANAPLTCQAAMDLFHMSA